MRVEMVAYAALERIRHLIVTSDAGAPYDVLHTAYGAYCVSCRRTDCGHAQAARNWKKREILDEAEKHERYEAIVHISRRP